MFEASILNDPCMFDAPLIIDPLVFDAPLAIDPRLLDVSSPQQPATVYSLTSNALQPAYQSPSGYVGTRGDLSLPELFPDQTLTASSNPMPVLGDISSLSDASTRRNASQAYQTLSPSSRSMPPPSMISSSRYAPIPDEYSPYYSLPRSSAPMSMPFDTSLPSSPSTHQEYVTPGKYVSSYPPLSPEEYTSPYRSFSRSSHPMSMPSDTLLPNSAPAPEESVSSYPPLTREEQYSPYHSFTTSFHPMPLPVDTSVPSSALTSKGSVHRSPYTPRRRKLLSMPKPVDTRSSSSALVSEDHVSPEEYRSPHAPRRRKLRSMRKPVETPSSSLALPPRDAPHVHQSSPTRSNLMPMPVDSPPLTSEKHVSSEEYTSSYAPRRRRLLSMPKPVETPSSSLAPPPRDAPQVDWSSPSSSSLIPLPVDPPSGYSPQSGYGPQPSYDNPPSHGAQPGCGAHPSIVHTASDGLPPIYGASSGYRYYLTYRDEPSDRPPASQAIPIAWGPGGIRQWPRDAGLVVYGARIYTDACGVVTPSNVPPGGAPVKAGLNRAEDKLQCPICESRFDRYRSITTHFSVCAKKNGNPEGKFWLDHPSLSRWRGPRLDRSLYMRNRAGYNALKNQGHLQYAFLAPATPRYVDDSI